MEELLAEQESDIKSFKHGDVVEGTVVRIDKDEILVDIGAKSEGVVSNRELFGRHGGEGQQPLAIGDTVLVYVLQPESPEGHAVLSLRRAGLERKWRAMQEQFEAGVIIEAPVIDHNKGGLIVDCGIRGFVPISQIVDFPRRPQNDQPRDAAQEIAEKLQPFVGRKLRLKILEVNRKANRLILSEKVALYEERREKRDELFSSLQVGQKVSGTVRSIAPFGVFIDLGGIDGLVHKSELSWNKVNNPRPATRSVTRSRPRSSTSITSAVGSACRSVASSPIRGIRRWPTSRSATSSTGPSRSSSTSAPSSVSVMASRA
jgi:small subunit ribosomal protein S1